MWKGVLKFVQVGGAVVERDRGIVRSVIWQDLGAVLAGWMGSWQVLGSSSRRTERVVAELLGPPLYRRNSPQRRYHLGSKQPVCETD
jgi:hypothetical protein